jgi:membrane fusion protein, multidrug efflux system
MSVIFPSLVRQVLIVVSTLAALTACGSASKDSAVVGIKPAMLISPVDLVDISSSRIASGPIISGSLQAQKQADLRAEVPAIVLQVLKDNGDQVKKGDLLVRLDDTIFRQALSSAREAERAAKQNVDQAERQFNRFKTLSGTGAVSTQAMEDAELRRNAAQSELASAHTRVVQESQQLARTEVRAPFSGVVGGREVSSGDTAQIGKALLKVIDPSSIVFVGFVSSEQITLLQINQMVNFHINGYPNQIFEGHIERINPVADASTRQVGVQVALRENKHLVVGLFAEGRVQTVAKQGLTIPESSLVQEGDLVYVWRVKKGVLNKIQVQLGARDEQSGDYAINAGLNEGDQVIRHPRGALVEGATVKMDVLSTAKNGV